MPGTYHGVIRGNTIELDQSPGFAEGEAVQVTITPSTNGASPSSPEALEALKRAAGAWHDDIAGLDRYLEWNRSQRKSNRRDVPA